MGAFARGAVKTLKGSFGYHGLIANRAEYKPKKNIENRVVTIVQWRYLPLLLFGSD